MEWILDAIIDCLKMLPFLFAAFLCMEAVEHYSGKQMNRMLEKAGRGGPVLGAALGCIPQCGFSVLASNLYAGGVITMGTLLAVFLATSDEAILLLLADPGHGNEILQLIGVKVLIGVLAGYLIDLIFRQRKWTQNPMHEICHSCGCHNHHGIVKPALKHTFRVFVYLLIFTLVLNLILELVGIEQVSEMLLGNTIFQPVIAAVIGLIPNCAASVVLTELYLSGAISFASVVAGLCTGAGVGLLVLFRVNRDKTENLKILGLLYLIGAASGMILELLHF
ncbi:MAG: putative manganese transporter [Candidatus Limivivens sp.]|nr:putative manganese transporter [Candidatus Limivivens sp.]